MEAYKIKDTDSKLNTTINFETVKQIYNGGCSFGLDNLKHYGILREMGWAYDFRKELKHYVYKQYDNWYECYAPNRTLLRKSTFGRISKILEIK